MKNSPEFRPTSDILEDSSRRESARGRSRKRIHMDWKPIRVWQLFSIEVTLTLLFLMIIMPSVRASFSYQTPIYWVGGSGSFSNNHHWAFTSGGGFCTCIPLNVNSVVFDSHSGSGIVTQDIALLITGPVLLTSDVTISISIQNGTTWRIIPQAGTLPGLALPNIIDMFIIGTSIAILTLTVLGALWLRHRFA